MVEPGGSAPIRRPGSRPLTRKKSLFSKGAIALVERMMPMILHRLSGRLEAEAPWKKSAFIPSPEAIGFSADFPFMASSACLAQDFFHVEFARLCELICSRVNFHRKLWELVFITHHLETAGMLGPGRRGLAFGVGREPLPAAFAELGCEITATDAPLEVGVSAGWQESGQFAHGLANLPRGRLDAETFESRVHWRECDMRAIDPALTDYDFCWSSCCFEHLGSLEAGLEFVVESVEKTLRIGGVAVHTTEFNLTSNEATIDHGGTVLFRRRDLEGVIARLRERGHETHDFRVSPGVFTMNGFVDTPPYGDAHLLINMDGFVTTSAGLVIRRGR
jgi:hypothetical protein